VIWSKLDKLDSSKRSKTMKTHALTIHQDNVPQRMNRRHLLRAGAGLTAATLVSACVFPIDASRAQSPSGALSVTEANKAIARSFIGWFDVAMGNLDGIDALAAPEATFHGFGPEAVDLAGFKQAITGLLSAFPDWQTTIESMIAEGDMVAVRFTGHGTHKGELQWPLGPFPATGKPVLFTGMAFTRIVQGKVVEHWVTNDSLSVVLQMGRNKA
jgi:predicted ester cyclase